MATTGIPTVDLAKFVKGDAASRASFVQELGSAFREIGFVAVSNHGIPQEIIDAFYSASKRYFSMPLQTKLTHFIPGVAGQRGYTAFGVEHAKQSEVPDLKEFFQIGQTVTDDDPIKSEYPENVVVKEQPDFSVLGDTLYREFEKTGQHLLRAIALFLGLDEHYFEKHMYNGNSILRAIHYPPITQEPKSAIRAESHEDIDMITLLVGASADGLQVLNTANEWIAVRAGHSEIVVNVGDMLQRLTNNYLKSTTHRVVNPPREEWHKDRLSIPFFMHPRSEMDLTCLSSCVSDSNPVAFPPCTAGEYLDERLREIGLKK
jgi:isopenicillin N synthase-like dioxygenase